MPRYLGKTSKGEVRQRRRGAPLLREAKRCGVKRPEVGDRVEVKSGTSVEAGARGYVAMIADSDPGIRVCEVQLDSDKTWICGASELTVLPREAR